MSSSLEHSSSNRLQPYKEGNVNYWEKKEGSGGRRVGWHFAFVHEAGTRAERSEAAVKDRDRATAVCGCLKNGSKSGEEGRCSVVVKQETAAA